MAGPLHVRAARPDDAVALAELHVRCWRETYAQGVPEPVYARMEEEAPARWARRLEDPDAGTTWVGTVRETGELAGFSRAEATGPGELRPLLLAGLYVLARWHGQGLGGALLEHAVGDAPAYLWVAEGNERAQRFYERAGFSLTGERRVEERFGGIADLRMVR
ncbi:Protein N-acetyltransferase, RimJ/RimL family [Georgenia satyanarayanai]|uniref:Protein N-acetyltransferase, RimJ/RimL family n=1 Tax=Georgenia satyanarayanai TaxID=860221 RepID=A0A2Y9BWY4_9MICO|nr:GNAT family N-acetyltransferase [Georgenia satyanarayanai]PYG00493.1 RimJ/RimL family protein N-acetyltransferase [Georgenia satyanarayanai]SSA39882.1 Protein N-acetyltransferase, RimJ/RimL family [Georgenia satyanarayanai]